ncbi:MAG TPA: DnaJ domain-containing protein [Candidatus Binatus sp.]|jgi:curved DNA-binding protein CbpA|nr:DnaJ domain-containing protein [Candidatus Binatus sp.]
MSPEPNIPRKYPRVRAPKGMWVGWKSAKQTCTSLAEVMGLGGLFLHTANPPSEGSSIELIFDLPTGQVRARAIVRSLQPNKGMGIQFVQMRPEDRAKLNKYLSLPELSPISSQVMPPASAKPASAHSVHSAPSYLALSLRSEEAGQRRFERDLRQLIELTGKGTYYQLLGVTSESPLSQVKKSYHALARKFHPDAHMGNRSLDAPVRDLMVIITEAYKTLENEEKRTAYDKRLAARGGFSMHREKTTAEESIQEWLKRANECLRAKNFVGSVVWLRKCIQLSPHNALYHATLARSLSTIPQYHEEAIEHFQAAIKLDPWREPIYLHFAELLEEMQLPERASEIYSQLLEFNPLHIQAREKLAELTSQTQTAKHSSRIPHLFGRKS